ncbi:hypothetical protein BH10ACI1_BH10ACI1_25780 [soil metagenome]
MSEEIKIIDSTNLKVRIFILIAVLLALTFGWYAIRWQLGNMLAELTSQTAPNAKSISEIAVSFAPSDPVTNWFAATSEADIFTPEKLENSRQMFEKTVRLAPKDFRWWIELGRADEQSDNLEKAEKAMLYAIQIAPQYTFPHWQLGNFYLRRGRDTEAFAELQKAADNNVVYREQVFSIAWDYYEKDTAKLEQIAGKTSEGKAGLAKFYASKERAEDSLRIWNSLSDDEKANNTEIAKLIAQALYDKRFFRSSLQFVRQLGVESNAKLETIENSGFESEIKNNGKVYFGWSVLPTEKVEVKTDPNQKHEGIRSLRVAFSGFSSIELYNILQIVAVQPSTRYRLSFWVRTENLRTAGTPNMEVVNANDDRIITDSKTFPNDTTDWQQVQVEFTTPANAEGITIRLGRSYCGNVCPIVGTIWLDDFNLEKLK